MFVKRVEVLLQRRTSFLQSPGFLALKLIHLRLELLSPLANQTEKLPNGCRRSTDDPDCGRPLMTQPLGEPAHERYREAKSNNDGATERQRARQELSPVLYLARKI